jgi:hypothetical protein
MLGIVGEIEQAFKFLGKIQAVVNKLLVEPVSKPSNWESEDVRLKLSAIQVLDSLLITLTAGSFNYLEKINTDDLKKNIAQQKWDKSNAPYAFDLPFRLLGRLEYIHNAIEFELNAEGKVVTPSWYITELIFQEFALYLKEISDKILIDGTAFFERMIKFYEDEKRFVEATIVASDALEMEAKSRHLLFVVKGFAEKLGKERSIENSPWVEWNWDAYEEQLNLFHDRIVLAQVTHLGNLFTWKKPLDFPDYFGKGVILSGEECLKSLRANNHDLFAKLFPKYLGGIFLTSEKLRINSQNLRPEQFLLLLAEPIMDLLDVSGYSLLYSEYHQNQALWEPCKVAWDEIIKANGKEFLERFALLIKHKKQSFGMTNRDISRSQWEIDFNSSMKSLTRKYEKIKGGRSLIGLSVVEHPSELIKVVGGHNEFPISFYRPDDIFIDLYLSHLPESKNLDFGLNHRISESMSRRKTRRQMPERNT